MSSICMLLMPDIHLHYPPDQTSKISQNFLYKCRNMIGRNKFLVSEYNLDFWFFLYAHFRIQCTSKLLVRKITCVVIFISMHLHLNQKYVFLLYILSQIEKPETMVSGSSSYLLSQNSVRKWRSCMAYKLIANVFDTHPTISPESSWRTRAPSRQQHTLCYSHQLLDQIPTPQLDLRHTQKIEIVTAF